VTTEDIWPAVEQLAEVWGTSELVQKFLERHPAQTDDTGVVTEGLRNLQAGTALLTKMPLNTAMWEAFAEQLPLVQVDSEMRSYLRAIAPIGHALESTVCWVRSRVPLYPRIPVPQFASRGFRRSEEAGERLPWRQQCLAAGLEREPTPPGVASILAIDDAKITSASAEVLEALVSSSEWRRYSDISSEMTGEDLAILDAARHRVGLLLNPKVVDEYEPARNERRLAYRRTQVQTVLDELHGRPRELADAFEVIDDLIDHALVDVHGQLVIWGRPHTALVTSLEVDGREVSFKYHGDDAPGVGSLMRLDDPLVPEVVLTDGLAMGYNQSEGSWLSYTGQRLPGTQAAFI
jgi:hypothetical protein